MAIKVDIALNIFAKPMQTALSILSLLRSSKEHIANFHLNFEPVASKHDRISPYTIAYWLLENLGESRVIITQPKFWLDLNATDLTKIEDPEYRVAIRYQAAFEHSTNDYLFIMHNDIFVQKDILGAMLAEIGEAFAIGQVGQCWNCPASHSGFMQELFQRPACYQGQQENFKPSYQELVALYELAEAKNWQRLRPYKQGFTGIFDQQPWPLPECRVNEWACLVNLAKTRAFTIPLGDALPFGSYRQCGPICLDIGVEWFRAMYRHGLFARHFNVTQYLKHWVGTGKVTPYRYALAEKNAFQILQKHFPDYLTWLVGYTKKDLHNLIN